MGEHAKLSRHHHTNALHLIPPRSASEKCKQITHTIHGTGIFTYIHLVDVCNKCIGKYTILYYTILYYTILYYTILYYTILYYTILYYTILYYTILYYTILYYTILYYTILYYTILYYILLYMDAMGNGTHPAVRWNLYLHTFPFDCFDDCLCPLYKCPESM